MFRNTFILTVMLTLVSSTPLFGQICEIYTDSDGFKYLIYEGDTCVFYNKEELQQIATRMVRSHECDTLLNIAYRELEYCDSINMAQDSIIVSGVRIIDQQTKIAQGFKEDRDELLKQKKKDDRKVKWLKIGWVSTSAVLTAVIIYLLLP